MLIAVLAQTPVTEPSPFFVFSHDSRKNIDTYPTRVYRSTYIF